MVAVIYMRIDQVMLHKMATDSVLGQYVAAVRVSELFEMLPAALMFTLAPILSVSAADPGRFRGYTDRTFRYFMFLASGLCVFMTVGARIIVRVLYGKQFLPAAPLLSVLIWSEIAVFFASVVANVMVARNQQNLLPIPTVTGAAVNIVLNLVLIPRYAAMGASWATLISYSVAWMVVLLFFRRTRSLVWQGIRFAVPIALVALLAVKAASFVSTLFLPSMFVGLTVFLVGAVVTGFLRKSDMGYFSTAVRNALARRA
jgi:polysaccharide transporter, PST family